MFQKLVAIEPVSLVPSAEKALYSFAGQVVMYPDIPANDDEIIARIGDADAVLFELYLPYQPVCTRVLSECEIHWNVLFTLFSRKCQCRYSLC